MSDDAQGSHSDLYIAIHLKPDDLKDWTPTEVYEFFRGMGRLMFLQEPRRIRMDNNQLPSLSDSPAAH